MRILRGPNTGGPAADNDPVLGHPVLMGVSVDTTSPASAAEGDARYVRGSSRGNIYMVIGEDNADNSADLGTAADGLSDLVGLETIARLVAEAPDGGHDMLKLIGDASAYGHGVLAASPVVPGASDVKSKTVQIGATSGSINTALDPTSGKKIRLLSYRVVAEALTTDPDRVGVYFGTGAAYVTNAASAIGEGQPGLTGSFGESWPDGAGPVGAADDNLSWITETETETALWITFHYREE